MLALLSACSDSSDSNSPESNEQVAIDAGALRLVITSSPWAMTFVDGAGEKVLAESADTGDTPFGTVEIFPGQPPEGNDGSASLTPLHMGMTQTPPQRDTGWIRATKLRSSSDDWVGTVATTNPAWTLHVRAHADGDGVIAIAVSAQDGNVQALSVSFAANEGEQFVGFGERGNAVNQGPGNILEKYVAEGPYQDAEYTFINAVVPPASVRWRPDTTYFPMPWLLSSRGPNAHPGEA